MPAVEVGRVCVKTTGREADKKCVIVDVVDKNFVLVTGPRSASGVKRRRVNVNHLKLTEETVKIKRGATDEEVAQALGVPEKTEKAEKTKKPEKLEKIEKPKESEKPKEPKEIEKSEETEKPEKLEKPKKPRKKKAE
jgi:large subunit ribosomal protein L14e